MVYVELWGKREIGEDDAPAFALEECQHCRTPCGISDLTVDEIVRCVFSGNWIKEEAAV